MPDLSLVVVRATHDSEAEIRAAWQSLESRLPSLKGRKFYGVCQDSVYYAGLQPLSPAEVQQFGLPTLVVKGGKYARVKLANWQQHTDQIPVILAQLESSFRTDPRRPVLEHYQSRSELHLLAPLADE